MSKNKPKGLLYQKYHNTIAKLRKHNLWSRSKKFKLNNFDTNTSKEIQSRDEIEGKLKFLPNLAV